MALENENLPAPPRHIAIIMDGNGRWAKKRGLPRTAGHSAGAEAFRRIANYCRSLGVEYLTVYAFSTENWRRPPEEVRTIMNIFDKYMKEALSIMERDKFKMRFFGERTGLSPELQRAVGVVYKQKTGLSTAGQMFLSELKASIPTAHG